MHENIDVVPYFLKGTSTLLGSRFERWGYELVYRLEGDQVLIVIYRRVGLRKGLKNPFKTFIWFIDFLQSNPLGICTIRGLVDRLGLIDNRTLAADRLASFYQRIGARINTDKDGQKWLIGKLTDYHPYNRVNPTR